MNRTKHRGRALAFALVPTIVLLAGPSLAAGDSAGLSGTVNVNTATADELQLLPGIGESRAKAVIAMRKQRGGFKALGDLREMRGIGEAGLERLRPFVRFEGKTTAQLL